MGSIDIIKPLLSTDALSSSADNKPWQHHQQIVENAGIRIWRAEFSSANCAMPPTPPPSVTKTLTDFLAGLGFFKGFIWVQFPSKTYSSEPRSPEFNSYYLQTFLRGPAILKFVLSVSDLRKWTED